MNVVLLTILAQAYGTNTYGAQTYACAENQSAAECTTAETPRDPDAGVAAQQSVFLLPGIALLVVVLYVGTLLVLKKRRSAKK